MIMNTTTVGITNTTVSTSSTTGALTVAGGVGIGGGVVVGKSVNIGSGIVLSGDVVQSWTVDAGNNTFSANIYNVLVSMITLTVTTFQTTSSFTQHIQDQLDAQFGGGVWSVSYAYGRFSFEGGSEIIFSGGSSLSNLLGFATDSTNIGNNIISTQTTGTLVNNILKINGNSTVDGKFINYGTNTEQFSVRKDSDDGESILKVDTQNGKVVAAVIQSNSGTTSVTTGGNVLTSFHSKSGFIHISWSNGSRLSFFDWNGGITTPSIVTLTTTAYSNNVTFSLNSFGGNIEIIATSNTTLDVYWSVTYMGNHIA
jgi:hypothetical protein